MRKIQNSANANYDAVGVADGEGVRVKDEQGSRDILTEYEKENRYRENF